MADTGIAFLIEWKCCRSLFKALRWLTEHSSWGFSVSEECVLALALLTRVYWSGVSLLLSFQLKLRHWNSSEVSFRPRPLLRRHIDLPSSVPLPAVWARGLSLTLSTPHPPFTRLDWLTAVGYLGQDWLDISSLLFFKQTASLPNRVWEGGFNRK